MPKSAKTHSSKAKVFRVTVAKSAHPVLTQIERKSDPGSKQAAVINMLRAPTGATIGAMMQSTGWQQHSVRGFLAGVVRKKLKLKLNSKKIEGARIYCIDGGENAGAGTRRSKRRAA